jgi:CheY-like chemotaxis protein
MRSSLGRGTRFTLMVPLAPTQAPGTPIVTAEISTMNEFECLHILLIEDDALGSVALEGLLTSWGCQVSVAGDAQMACALLSHMPTPDFIVSDYRLRGLHNGVDAVRLLRAASGQDIAACVISGDTDVSVRQQTQAAGLVLLQKPVRPAKLRSLLRHFVQARIAKTDESEAAAS